MVVLRYGTLTGTSHRWREFVFFNNRTGFFHRFHSVQDINSYNCCKRHYKAAGVKDETKKWYAYLL